ncbi:hypothetical protein [Mobiluncus mulieris]|uniref:Alpha-lytic endopeptidase n=1 Tax=Mobiluncus mulieris TaxID=2052 RepID=A0A7Y0USX5_9ACTO|nr:hypothetical protein [Mobiluncus mulieris]NMX03137.1 hypothetical protein [Mobiluncus mulieris]
MLFKKLTKRSKIFALASTTLLIIAASNFTAHATDSEDFSKTIDKYSLEKCLVRNNVYPEHIMKKYTSDEKNINEVDKLKSTLYYKNPEKIAPIQIRLNANSNLQNLVIPVINDNVKSIHDFNTVASTVHTINKNNAFSVEVKQIKRNSQLSVAKLCKAFNELTSYSNDDDVMGAYINDVTGKLTVHVSNTNAVKYIKKTYPFTDVKIIRRSGTLSRENAAFPFPGGITAIRGYDSRACTAGYRFTNNGSNHYFMTTAGHCENNGGFFTANTTWSNGGNYLGKSIVNFLGSNQLDVLAIQGTGYSTNILRGTEPLVFPARVLGSLTNPTPGAIVGTSGIISKEQHLIYGGNAGCQRLAMNGQTSQYCNLFYMNPNGSTLYEGDSGGPVFAMTANSTEVYALGTITGYINGSYLATNITAIQYVFNSHVG